MNLRDIVMPPVMAGIMVGSGFGLLLRDDNYPYWLVATLLLSGAGIYFIWTICYMYHNHRTLRKARRELVRRGLL